MLESRQAILQQTAADVLRHKASGTFPLADQVMTLPADTYTCPHQFERERQRIFQRVPLLLAASCELPAKGDFKTLDIAGVPVLIARGRDEGGLQHFHRWIEAVAVADDQDLPALLGAAAVSG